MVNSNFNKYLNQVKYYEDLTKFATLGLFVLNALGADLNNIEDLIGEYPMMEEASENRELDEDDLELIEMCNNLGLKYKITTKGIKIGT